MEEETPAQFEPPTDSATLFTESNGEAFRFYLPMSLASRSSFKEKIESHGGVIVGSELMPNIIKIGDPAKPQSFDASWLSFRYVDDAIRENELQNAEYYVMDNPPEMLMLEPTQPSMHLGQRATPSSGGLPSGVGSRGTRMEFTPEEDDILRRIVHRPGVATSGNKIYQLIASQYGGHSFHSWRDRYIRHMRPIWGPPTEDQVLVVNDTDDYILSQSYLRAPHTSATARPQVKPAPLPTQQLRDPSIVTDNELINESGTSPTTPSTAIKKQRASFTTTDDEILLSAIAEKRETAATFKYLGSRHPHHTWESWKNRVKAIKKKHGGILPTPDDFSKIPDMPDDSQADLSMQDGDLQQMPDMPAMADVPEEAPAHVQVPISHDPNIDPNLQQIHNLATILEDPNQAAFEEQFPDQQGNYHQQDADLQAQLQAEDAPASSFEFPETEQLLRQNLQGHTPGLHQQAVRPLARRRSVPTSARKIKREINIHDPSADENAGAVSDIDDATQQVPSKRRAPVKVEAKKRKTNAAARAAAARAEASPRAIPVTPMKQVDFSASNPKSARMEHHERQKPGLVKAVRDDALPQLPVEMQEPRRSTRVRGASAEPQASPAKKVAKGRGRSATQRDLDSAGMPLGIDPVVEEDDMMAEEQIRRSVAAETSSHPSGAADSAGQLQDHNPRSIRRRGQQEVRATPNSSPSRATQTGGVEDGATFSPGFEAPSPTPVSPNRAFSQGQFLQDTQAIRGEVDFDFDTTIPEMEMDSQEARRQAELQLAADQRRQGWMQTQLRQYGPALTPEQAEDAWHQTCGVPTLAARVVQAYVQDTQVPRLPGIWTDEDDALLYSTDAKALESLYRFHGSSVDTRIAYLG